MTYYETGNGDKNLEYRGTEKGEKRKKQLADVRRRRAQIYKKFIERRK